MVTIKSKKEIEIMKKACEIVAIMYQEIEKYIKPGISTWELDQIAEKTMRKLGGIPAEKGYPSGFKGVPNYPAATCISVNDEVILGIPPKTKIIKEGRYCKHEYSSPKRWFHGDGC